MLLANELLLTGAGSNHVADKAGQGVGLAGEMLVIVDTSGLLEGNVGQLWIQVKSVLIVAAWSAVGTFVIVRVVDAIMGLRATAADERLRLDKAIHGEMVD